MSIESVSIGLPAVPIVATVAIFAVVQSLFGVGLLLFGTPTLLLLGLPFNVVLAYLLPCSIVVSVLQVATSGGLTLEPIRKQFLALTAPAVLVATCVAITLGSPLQLRAGVGGMLLLTGLMRLGRFQAVLSRFIRRNVRPLMLLLGVTHGLSNLGGGILTAIVGASFEDKVTIRRHIAFAYGTMASVQLLVVLLSARPHLEFALWIALPALAGGTYLLLGQKVFRSIGQRPYQFGLTGLILSFGLLLVGTA